MGRGPVALLAGQAGAEATNWALDSVANPYLLRRMQLFLREGNFDIIQCYGLRAEALCRWVARGLGIRLISSIRSTDPWRRWYHVALDRLTLDGVTAWISNSEAGKRARMQREGTPGDKIFVVPNGIPDRPLPDAEARAKARRRLGLDDANGPVLAVLANIRQAKGHEDLLEALVKLREKFPALVCLCAGRDDSGGRIPTGPLARRLGGAVRWLGFVDDPASVYDAADLAVLPSHWEGMPHALIEALRAGLPSVATEVGGTPEVIRHEKEGLLCPPGSPGSLARAIERALEDEEGRRRWGASARRRYEENFRVEVMVERLTEIYLRVAALPWGGAR